MKQEHLAGEIEQVWRIYHFKKSDLAFTVQHEQF